MQIIDLDQNNETILDTWKNFLDNYPHLIIHTPKYKEFLEKTFPNTKIQYLAVVIDDEIKTILPINMISHSDFIKNALLDKKIISSAFLEYGSFAGEENQVFVDEILNHIHQNHSKNYNYLEIRQGLENFNKFLEKKLIKKTEYKRFELKLIDIETNWKLIQKEKRKAIRKSEKEGIVVKELNQNHVAEIYKLYLKNMKQFGSPPFPKTYFTNFFELNLGKCFGAYYNDELVSFLLGFCHKQSINLIIAVSDRKFLWSRCNDAVHWHFIKYAINNNYNVVDFGRVRLESGQFDYKRKWGCELKDLDHFYDLYLTDKLPNEDPSTNKKLKLLTNIWKTFPLTITKKLGPWAREGIGK
tara:strand:- start:1696 stop:2763 length:1068 start_codon:yes stop_codon:yes gene_type:complete